MAGTRGRRHVARDRKEFNTSNVLAFSKVINSYLSRYQISYLGLLRRSLICTDLKQIKDYIRSLTSLFYFIFLL